MSAILKICQQARQAAVLLARASTDQKDQALAQMAEGLMAQSREILAANQKDLKAAKKARLSQALTDRLLLNQQRLEQMAQGLADISALPDPVGQVTREWTQPNGLKIAKVRIPIGVIGFIYESRPNVTSDAAGLCVKSGNAVILRGGSEAHHSNQALAKVLGQALHQAQLPKFAVQTLPSTDRSAIDQLLKMEDLVDLIIPRGGEALIRRVAKNSRIPVLKHYKGVCHLFIDESADPQMAQAICLNAKTQRPGVCNAIETLLVHRTLKSTLLPRLIAELQKAQVQVRGTPEVMQACPGVQKAAKSDFGKEFLDLILAVKLVASVEEAITHIQQFGSQHTESIVTENKQHAELFLNHLQSSVVLVNASTRFADGGEMGMGAEIGISTTKLHAFGPMGLEDLTICHYLIRGNGQVRR